MKLQDSRNAWRQFELTGTVADYLRYRSVSELPGITASVPVTVREDRDAAESKGSGAESPSHWGE